MPSNRCPRATSSIESATTSRETSDVFIPDVPIVIPSEIAIVLNSIGVPPAARIPSFTLAARARSPKLHGIVSVQVDATPLIGFAIASASKPIPWRYERAAARAGPSVSWRDWCLGSSLWPSMTARTLSVRGLGQLPGAGAGARGACEPLALPAAQPPEVSLDLARVDLAARQVQVGLGDDPPLVTLQRHPLREHVVGVGQAWRAVRAGLVREFDAVLVQQPAGLGQVGDDRLVRIDQVGVVDAAQVARPLGVGLAAPDAQEPEVAVHRPLLVVHARLEQLARTLLGAALAPGVVRGAGIAGTAALAAGAAGLQAAVDPGHRDLPQQREDDDRGRRERDDHYAAPPAARGKKMTRPVSRGISSNRRTISASRRPSQRVVGTAAHIPWSSWRRNSSISACSSWATSTSPSAISCSPNPGRMRRNFIEGDYTPVAWASWLPEAPRVVSPRTSTGPAPRPIPRSPSRTAAAAIALAVRAACRGERPRANCAARTDECVQPEPCAAPSGW